MPRRLDDYCMDDLPLHNIPAKRLVHQRHIFQLRRKRPEYLKVRIDLEDLRLVDQVDRSIGDDIHDHVEYTSGDVLKRPSTRWKRRSKSWSVLFVMSIPD
jgi:hypothetical protein